MKFAEAYAKALRDIFSEERQPMDNFLKNLRHIQKVWDQKEIKSFFVSPVIASEKKKQVLKKSLGSLVKQDLLCSFLLLLLDKNQTKELPYIIHHLTDMNNHMKGTIVVRVQTCLPLSKDVKEGIQKFFKKYFNRAIELTEDITSEHIGGLKVHVGDFVFTDTVLFHLKQMENQIRGRFYDNKCK